MSTKKDKVSYDYTIALSSKDSFIASESLLTSLPEEFFQEQEDQTEVLSENLETQVWISIGEKKHSGKLVSFEVDNNQTVLYFEIKKTAALYFIKRERLDAVEVVHGDAVLYEALDVPKLKDTVSVDLTGSGALVTLTIRKIAYTERSK